MDAQPPPQQPITRLFGVSEAPVFRPTAKEFSDPMSYIQSIHHEASKAGLCKIIPPDNWRPPFSLDTKNFSFPTRLQQLSSMNIDTRPSLNYLDALQKFHSSRGSPFTKIPTVSGNPVDLLKLRNLVASAGGYDSVVQDKKWTQFASAFGVQEQKSQSLNTSLRQIYVKWILPYEKWLNGTYDTSDQMTPHKTKHVFESDVESGSDMESGSDEDILELSSEDSVDEDDSASESGAQIQRRTSPRKKPSSKSIEESDQEELNSRPRRLRNTNSLEQVFNSRMENLQARTQARHSGRMSRMSVSPSPEGHATCQVCSSSRTESPLFTCYECDLVFHMSCLKPCLASVPHADWYCPDCIKNSGKNFGFEDGPDHTLDSFKVYSDNFVREWFGNDKVPEIEMEKEFWRLVESPFENVTVQYGADLHTAVLGSAFPVPEKQPDNPYSHCLWNLNNMPIAPGSMLRYIKKDISGMMVPWLYAGAAFSTFCWHAEDHMGHTKTWYGIPSKHADAFEKAMKETAPQLFETNPDLLFHITMILSPRILIEKGVSIYGLDQRPGDIVITFPRGYHSGFNHGFNLAEAVNFATPDWIPFGYDCIQTYARYSKLPVFCHDELILTAASQSPDSALASWLKEALETILEDEGKARTTMVQTFSHVHHVNQEVEVEELLKDSCSVQCRLCKKFCYLSYVTCLCSSVCTDHVNQLCTSCQPNSYQYITRISIESIKRLESKITGILNEPILWKMNLKQQLTSKCGLRLKDLVKMAKQGEELDSVDVELSNLKAFIVQVQEWSQEAAIVLSKKKQTFKKSKDLDRKPAGYGVRSLVTIQRLLDTIHRMNMDMVEIEGLTVLRDEIESFEAEVRFLLASPCSLEQISSLQKQGSSLACQSEALDLLDAASKQHKWKSVASPKSVIEFPISQVDDIVAQGLLLGLATDPTMSVLQDLVKKGREWEKHAKELLGSSRLSLKDLEELETRSRDLPVDRETLDSVLTVLKPVRDWCLRSDEWIALIKSKAEIVPPLSLEDLSNLIEQGESFPLKLEFLSIMKDAYRKLVDWKVSLQRVLLGKSKPMNVKLEEILQDYESNIQSCINLCHDDEVYCICRTSTDSGLMVECESCLVWYHLSCLGISKKRIATDEAYICPVCDPYFTFKPPYHRSQKSQWNQIQTQAKKLSLLPPEYSKLKRLDTLIEDWSIHIRSFYVKNEEAQVEIKVLKDLLRSCLGLPVVLAEEINTLSNLILGRRPLSNEPKDATLFCICRTTYDPAIPMIGCDGCDDWFHFGCIGVDPDTASTLNSYLCNKCSPQTSALDALAALSMELSPIRHTRSADPISLSSLKTTAEPAVDILDKQPSNPSELPPYVIERAPSATDPPEVKIKIELQNQPPSLEINDTIKSPESNKRKAALDKRTRKRSKHAKHMQEQIDFHHNVDALLPVYNGSVETLSISDPLTIPPQTLPLSGPSNSDPSHALYPSLPSLNNVNLPPSTL